MWHSGGKRGAWWGGRGRRRGELGECAAARGWTAAAGGGRWRRGCPHNQRRTLGPPHSWGLAGACLHKQTIPKNNRDRADGHTGHHTAAARWRGGGATQAPRARGGRGAPRRARRPRVARAVAAAAALGGAGPRPLPSHPPRPCASRGTHGRPAAGGGGGVCPGAPAVGNGGGEGGGGLTTSPLGPQRRRRGPWQAATVAAGRRRDARGGPPINAAAAGGWCAHRGNSGQRRRRASHRRATTTAGRGGADGAGGAVGTTARPSGPCRAPLTRPCRSVTTRLADRHLVAMAARRPSRGGEWGAVV